MKKIFTKLFLLTTLLMVSSELWAQDPLVMCLITDKQTITKNTTKDLIYNLPGPGTGLNLHLECDGASDYYYSIYGYSELDCGGTRKTIASGSDYGLFFDYYNIEGYKSIKFTITAPRRDVVEMNLDISARYANIPNPYTFDNAGYNSANASKSFTMDYYGAPPTINYEYVTGDGKSGSEKFPISFAYSNGKITMNVQYRHNEIGTHKAEIKLNYSTTNLFTRFYVSGTTTKANQTIAWTPPTVMTVGDSHTLSATAPGGAVSYAVTGDAVTRSGNTLTAVKAGTVTITASQAGNSNYNAAASVTKTITIKKATPTVSAWPTIAPVTYGTNLGAALILKGGSASVAGTFVITSSYTAATVPNAGTHTYSVEFRPTESNKYNNVAGGTATLTVNKANQTIAWTATPPTEMTVGDTHTLSATATSGDAVAFAISGDAATLAGNTLTAVKAGTVTITASQAGNSNYNAAASVTKTITVNKATPTVSAWPTLNAVTYGAKLEQALVLVGGTASVAGTFVITDSYNAATVPNAGAHTYSVEFRPTESNKYNNVSGGTATLTVNKADQVIAWTATPPTEMTVGDSHTLSATALGGTVTFAITGDAATLAENTLTAVQAGTVTITASQAGNGNYNAAANVTHTITINKATPTVTAWPTLNAVTYGATLEQALVLVGGTASVEGTFAITDAYTAATVPNAGTHTYNLEFRPTESNKYNVVSGGTATLTVNKADQVIAWTATPPTEMTVGDTHTLSATATSGDAVAFAISGDAATLADNTLTAVQAGTVTITASQAGNSNYNAAASVTKTITVNKATPTVSAWPTLNAVTYGAKLEQALVLVGGTASVAGTFVITDSYNAATVPNAGAHTYSVEFRPTESNKYNNVSGGTATLTVNKADQVIAWTATPPTEMTVGDSHTLSATALGGVVAFAITGDAATLAGNTLTAVQAGTVTITASQAGNSNYNAAANVTHTITINKATPTVTAWPTLNAVTYGATLEQALVLVGGTASVEGTFVITDAYTAATVPNAGAHTYNLEFRPTESNKYNNVSGGTATLTVNKADQAIAWTATPPTEMTVGDSHTLSATALGGVVAFAITGDAATLADNTLTAVQAGTVTITASQAGNSNYNAAASVTKTITVNKATPTVTAWPTLNAVTYGATLEQALVLVGGTASVEGTFVITSSYTAATVPNAGAHTYGVEFRPTESNKYNNVSGGTATLTVNKADQVIAWTATPPTEMTVGDSHTLSATAPGGTVAFAITGDAATLADNTLTAVQAGTVTITASQAGNSNYNPAANVTHTITINKATPTVTAWPTLNAVTYGATLDQALVLVGGTASVAGTFVITDSYNAVDVPNAGTHTYGVEFRPTESNKYNNVSGGIATLTVNKADQVIAWTATPPTEMTVGDSHTLSATATSGDAVAFAISGEAATLTDNTLTAVQAGTVTITASQAGNSNYNPAANVTKTITVNKATPTVTAWPTLDAVTYGTTLEQALVLIGGTASVAGTFVITDTYTAATVPNAGAHTYNLEFRPTESNKYNNVAGGTATLTVNKADQVIAWTATPPTEMTVGDSHTLSATALGGAVAYAITGDAATLADNTLTAVQAGTVTITASQAGNGNYNAAANITHTITINKATPTVTAWPTLNAVTYGATLEQALVLVGGTASVAGTFVITDTYTAATVPNAGTHTYSVEFRPTESNKYNNVAGGTATLTINQATPSVTWPTFAEVTYGTTLRDALQLVGGNANVEGAFHISGEYNEEEVPVVGTYKYAVWFNPTDYTNYTSLYKDDVTLTVNKANQTITWDFADCTLLPGQTLELNATATCGAMTYLVSGAAISVSGTTLTAVAEGTASIKATHAGNENYNAIESPEYTITVSASGYTRTVTNGDYGTICLPYGSSNYSGAEFYEIAYAEIKNGDAIGLYLDQIEEGAALVAGKPYIFKATADILIVTYEGAIVDAPVAGDAGLTGTLVDIPANDVLVGNYIIAQNMFWDASAENYLNANHAYINKTILLQTEPKSLVPGRRRVSMGETSGNVATDVENSQLPMINSQKLIENGLLIIIRDGVKYNAHGQKL